VNSAWHYILSLNFELMIFQKLNIILRLGEAKRQNSQVLIFDAKFWYGFFIQVLQKMMITE